MLCGCTTTSMASGGRSNSQQASINSSPLFMRLAESTEILRPMDQLGCAQACSGVAASICARDHWRKGPPEAVSSTLHTPVREGRVDAEAGRHWKMALCSLSMGNRRAPDSRTAAISSCPPITSDSLLASNTVLPACAAARVEGSPAAPTMAAMTVSTAASVTTCARPASPCNTSVAQSAGRRARRLSAAASSAITA